MNSVLVSALISALPVAELRGGIPYAVASGVPLPAAFVLCTCANLLVIPIVYFFLDCLHSRLMKFSLYARVFTRYIESKRGKLEKYAGTKAEFIALVLFVGIPLPATGAYTGTLLAWFFNMGRRKAYLAVGLGVLMAGLIVLLAVMGVIGGVGLLTK